MEYKVLTEEDIRFFQKLIEPENVLVSDIEKYSRDYTEDLQYFPDVVLKPGTAQEIAQIVRYCNQKLLPITPRGAGTGLAGGSLAVKAGVMVSIERLNKIIEIDEKNFIATVEAGVVNFDLQKELAEKGLFYPPDPSSWHSSFIGGNVATNAGGTRAVKYGVTRSYVLNLEVVLPNGDLIWTGANTMKFSTGLDVTELFIGSEGILGIITKVVLKVIAKPRNEVSILIPFKNIYDACEAVSAIFYSNILPSAIEFMEQCAIDCATEFLNDKEFLGGQDAEAHLLVSLDGEIENQLARCVEVASGFEIGDIIFAETETEKNRLWTLRRRIAEAARAYGYTIEEDTVVPRANLVKLIKAVHQLADKNRFKVVCYGHAGDGNLHIRINHPKYKNSYKHPEIRKMLNNLFEIVKDLNGTISGEHGIGLVQKDYLPIVFSEANLNLQRTIKNAVDPRNIMNPGKVVN